MWRGDLSGVRVFSTALGDEHLASGPANIYPLACGHEAQQAPFRSERVDRAQQHNKMSWPNKHGRNSNSIYSIIALVVVVLLLGVRCSTTVLIVVYAVPSDECVIGLVEMARQRPHSVTIHQLHNTAVTTPAVCALACF